jgi:hypothetical protein
MGIDAVDITLIQTVSFADTCPQLFLRFSTNDNFSHRSIMSGHTPCEHGWLGWKQYFSEVDRIVIPFRNTDFYTGENAADYQMASRFMPYQSIFDQINEVVLVRHIMCQCSDNAYRHL